MPSLRLVTTLIIAIVAAGAVAQSQLRKNSHAAAAPAATQPAPLDPRSRIPFHGRLTDASGNGITSTTNLVFTLYTSATASSVFGNWSETHSVTPQDGWFSLVLGDVTAGGVQFPADWDGTELWLGITVQGDTEMTPRTPILPVPFAAIANPTQHKFTHDFGGTDELGSQSSTANELVRANGSGVVDPSWLPAASGGSPGVVTLNSPGSTTGVVAGTDPRLTDARPPLPHAASHMADGGDPVAVVLAAAGAIPETAPGNSKLDISWIPTASTAQSSKVPVANSSSNALDITWIPTAATAQSSKVPVANSSSNTLDISWIPTAATAQSSKVPVANSSSNTLDISWIPTAATAQSSKVPIANTGGSFAGKLDPSWLPGATSTASTVAFAPIAHAATHEAGGSDPVGSAVGTANGIPYADGSGHLDISWMPTAATAQLSKVPVADTSGAFAGKLDPSWLPGATSTASTVAFAPTAHAASHESGGSDPVGSVPGTPNGIPYADSSGHLDSWINTLSQAHGGTSTAQPKITRNLCFFVAGPTSNTGPTLMVPPDLTNCLVTSIFGSSQTVPWPQGFTFSIARLNPPAPTPNFPSGLWSAGSSTASVPAASPVNANDVLYATFSGQQGTDVTVCAQISCNYSFQ